MKKTIKFLLLLPIMYLGCNDNDFIGQPPTENTPPGIVTDINTESISGGAIISYTPPSDPDFSYVEAVYKVNESLTRKAKSTKYTQKITVDGFPNSNPQTVTLYAVDYNGNKSEPIETQITPLKPPYIEVFESLKVRNDFAGVFVEWENLLEKYMGITVLRYDEFNDFVPYEVIYDDFTTFNTNVRGLEAEDIELGFFVRDEFGNVSDTLVNTFKPLFEIELDKAQWEALALDTDIPVSTKRQRSLDKAYDGILTQGWTNSYISTQVSSLRYLPHHQTYDLGEENLISRFIYQPVKSWAYKQGGWKKMEIYGTNDQSLIDRETNGVYEWSGGDDPNVTGNWREEGMDGWEYIGEFEVIKPSGLPGTQVEAGDNEFAEQGIQFNFPSNISYRYIRFRTIEMWGNVLYSGWAEMTLFGAPIN